MNLPDPRNADILVHVRGELKHRADATVSVFDSVVQGGDAVWEGLRVYDGRIADLEGHLERLQNSADCPLNRTLFKPTVVGFPRHPSARQG